MDILEKDSNSIITSSTPNFLPLLHSYHPCHSNGNKIAHILARVQVYGHELASDVSNRFESTVVQERVFKAEYNTWWSIFFPGSRVQFLSPVEARHLQPRPTTCFFPMSQNPFTSVGNQENHSMSPGVMLEPDTSRISPYHLHELIQQSLHILMFPFHIIQNRYKSC